jgi:uncharacterized membrane protein YhaH (DUF805 family)
MNWIIGPLRKYADFSGRANRKEFWSFALFVTLTTAAAHYSDQLDGKFDPITAGMGIFELVIFLILLLPFISVAVRRLHDTNRSGWWTLFLYVPYVGFVVAQRGSSPEMLAAAAVAFLMGVAVLSINLILPGDPSSNSFGSAPGTGL